MLRLAVAVLSFLAVFTALSGCRDPQISSYRVKKEPTPLPSKPIADIAAAPPSAPGQDMASTPVATAQGSGLTWTAPAHWTAKTASAMRRGTFIIKGKDASEAELSITAFPGDVGGNLANVNRWRGQLQLPPITQADLAAALTPITANGLTLHVVDLQGPAGPKAQRVLGAIVPLGQSTWFFKLTGPDALVFEEKSAFLAFLKTVRVP